MLRPPPPFLTFLASTSHLLLISSTHAPRDKLYINQPAQKFLIKKYIIDLLAGTSISMFGTIQIVFKRTKAAYAT